MQIGLAFVTGPLAGRVLSLGGNALVGRHPQCDVVLEDAAVDARHAQLYPAGNGFQLLDLRSVGGSFVDGLRVPPGQPVVLALGCLLRFGEGGPLAILDATERFGEQALTLVREDDGEVFPVPGPLVVGRSRSCELRLRAAGDAVASSRHLHVLPAFGRLVVTDLGSANGTFLPGNVRVVQVALPVGARVNLGGAGGPWFRVDVATATLPPPTSLGPAATEPSALPPCFKLRVASGEARGRIDVACKTEVSFGAFAGLSEFEITTFPRELEDEGDAAARGESIDPQHGQFVLTADGVDLVDGGSQRTKLDGRLLEPGERRPLGECFELWLGDDVVFLRGRVFRHPRLAPTAPVVGQEGQHPVECLVLERGGDGDVESRLYLLLVRQASIGSADDAALRLPMPGVAPLHAALSLRGGRLWIASVSEAPLAVDGAPVARGEAVPLRVGSTVYLGAVRVEVSE
ncbi:MAG: FHA domain-containing protein [Planctomycetota bacterium]|nr:MAG: FHA domain-containing protein [Planctomycetota bacterium]